MYEQHHRMTLCKNFEGYVFSIGNAIEATSARFVTSNLKFCKMLFL